MGKLVSRLLIIATIIAIGTVFLLALSLIRDLYRLFRYGTPIHWRNYDLFDETETSVDRAMAIIIIIGLTNALCMELYL